MEGGSEPVEITMRKVEDLVGYHGRYVPTVFSLHFGDRQIEVSYADDDEVAAVARWIRDVQRVHRQRLRGGGRRDLVVGLCTFLPKPWVSCKKYRKAARGELPITGMSLCAGGTHCLVVPVEDREGYRSGRRPFPPPLAVFLGDHRIKFVGIGIREAAERMERVLGVRVANAMDLRSLVAGAFGRQAVPPLKGGGGDADGLRKMASVALDGVDAGKKPAAVESTIYDISHDMDDLLMYAAVDAFLTCQIANACSHKIGAPKASSH